MGIFDRIAGTIDELVAGNESQARERTDEDVRLARQLVDRGDVDEGMARISELVVRFPQSAEVREARGEMRRRIGDLEAAAADFGRAVDLESGRASAWVNLGETLSALSRWEPARDALRRASTLSALTERERPRVLLGLGHVYGQMGQHAKAIRELRKGAEQSPDDPQMLAALGRALLIGGDLGEGADCLGRAARLTGGDVGMLVEAAQALATVQQVTAKGQLEPAWQGPVTARAIDSAAGTPATTDADVPLLWLREAVTRAPESAHARAALARRLAYLGDLAAAHHEASVAAQAHAESPEVWAVLCELHFRGGDFAAAREAARHQQALGLALPFGTWLAIALGTRDPAAIDEALRHGQPSDPGYAAANAFSASNPDRDGGAEGGGGAESAAAVANASARTLASDPAATMLLALARLAPDEASRRFVLRRLAPPPPPQLPSSQSQFALPPSAGSASALGLLIWAREFAAAPARTAIPVASLMPMALLLSRAVEAFDRPLLLAVMGEFNAGKSSFVNALAGDDVARVGVTPTTATINILRHGPSGGGRIRFQDGSVRDLRADQVTPYLATLGDAEANRVRLIEVYSPAESLRHIEIVDTPGLNALRPEHERVAREFLAEADAVVWVFALGQAAKRSEREALDVLQAAGKLVLGVVNKVDGAAPVDVQAVIEHVDRELGGRLVRTLPFSARLALQARRAGDSIAAEASGLVAVEKALDQLFFARARQLKQATAISALKRFAADAGAQIHAAESQHDEQLRQVRGEQSGLRDLEAALRSAIDAERVALRARIDRAMRSTAADVREFIRPRSWPFGEHRVETEGAAALADLLDDAVTEAVDTTAARLRAEIKGKDHDHPHKDTDNEDDNDNNSDDNDNVRADPVAVANLSPVHLQLLIEAVVTTTEAFQFYVRGFLEGAAAIFLRADLPHLRRLDLPTLSASLAAYAPNPDRVLFHPLAQRLAGLFASRHAALDAQRIEIDINRLALDEWLALPLGTFASALASNGSEPAIDVGAP